MRAFSLFLKRTEDSADQIPDSEVDMGMAIIRGMADENEKKRISFEFYKESDEKLTQAAIFEVGKKVNIIWF